MAAQARSKARTFYKMHGVGNDMIIFDCLKDSIPNPAPVARRVCNRHTGIGADQMLLLQKSRKADFLMRVFNADGSEAEMCGNGIRCIGQYIRSAKLSVKKELKIETLSGIKNLKFLTTKTMEVDMGEPVMKGKEIPVNLSGRIINRPLKTEAREFRITCLSVGNPHCITFHEDLQNLDVARFGPLLETYPIFPKKTNVSFVNVVSKNEIQIRVWERGVGETFGCGTAACASTVAAVLNGYTDRKVTAALRGGKLEIEWDAKDNHIYMRGPAEFVFKGEVVL